MRRVRAAVVFVVLAILMVVAPTPARASRPPTGETIHFAVTGTNGAVWVGPGAPGGWGSLGGHTDLTPAVGVVQLTPNTFNPLYVVVGDDDALWVRGPGRGWQHLSENSTFCADQPGLYTESRQFGSGFLTDVWVACQGADGAVWYASGTVSGDQLPVLNTWNTLGGDAAFGVGVARVGSNITFVVNGTDTEEFTSVWIRTLSEGWTKTPWGCLDTPALASAYGRAWFGCWGLDDALWYARNFIGSWTQAQSAGGVLTGAPGAAVTFSGATFGVPGTDQAVWQNYVNNQGAPHGWSSAGGVVPEGLGVAAVGVKPTPA